MRADGWWIVWLVPDDPDVYADAGQLLFEAVAAFDHEGWPMVPDSSGWSLESIGDQTGGYRGRQVLVRLGDLRPGEVLPALAEWLACPHWWGGESADAIRDALITAGHAAAQLSPDRAGPGRGPTGRG